MNIPSTIPISDLKLLIVEDEAINRFVLEKLLRIAGCDFTFSGSGEEALIACGNGTFDVILLDIELPGMNGYETAAAITNTTSSGLKRPAMIAMTGHQQPDEEQSIIEKGFDNWIVKPFDIEQLTQAIRKTLETKDTRNLEKQPIIKLDLLNSIAGDDPEFVTLCIELFMKEMPENLDRLKTAIEANDWETIRTTSHKMKTSLNYMGLDEQRLAAANIEKLARERRDFERIRMDAERIRARCQEAFIELRQLLNKHEEAKP